MPVLTLEAALGWDEHFPLVKPGHYAPLRVSITTQRDLLNAQLIISTPLVGEGERQRPIRWSRPVTVPAGGSKQFEAQVYMGPDLPPVEVRLTEAGRTLEFLLLQPIGVDPGDSLVLVLGPRRGSHAAIQRHGHRRPLYPPAPRLPSSFATLSALDALVIDSPLMVEPPVEATTALKSWVHGGGTLLVCTGSQGLPTRNAELLALLPAQPTRTVGTFDVRGWLSDNDLSARPTPSSDPALAPRPRQADGEPVIFTARPLEPSDPRANPLFQGQPLSPVAPGSDHGESATLGYTIRRGLGRVTVLGFSLASGPAHPLLDHLSSVALLLPRRRAMALAPSTVTPIFPSGIPARGFNLSAPRKQVYPGLVALAEPLLGATLFSIPSRRYILYLLGLYLVTLLGSLLAGSRLVGRREWAWLSLPLVVATFIAAIWDSAMTTGQSAKALSQIELVEVASGDSLGTSRSLLSIHSPLGGAFEILPPPGLTAEPAPTPDVRGLAVPPLHLAPDDARSSMQTKVVEFSILARSSRILRLSGPVTLDGSVTLVPTSTSGDYSGITVRNGTSETFSRGALLIGGAVSYLESLAPNTETLVDTTVASPMNPRVLTSTKPLRKPASPGEAHDEVLAMTRKLSHQLLNAMLRQVHESGAARVKPMAILISAGSTSQLNINDRPVRGLKVRALLVHGSWSPPGLKPVTVRPHWTLVRTTTANGCHYDRGVLIWTSGDLLLDLEPPPELEAFSLVNYTVQLSGRLRNPLGRHPNPIVAEQLGPDGSWTPMQVHISDRRRPRPRLTLRAENRSVPGHATRLRLRGAGANLVGIEFDVRKF